MIFDLFSDSKLFLLEYSEAQPAELREALRKLLEAHFFIYRTGQIYHFWDYHKSLGANRPASLGASLRTKAGAAAQKARDHLAQLLGSPQAFGQKESILANIDTLDFIVSGNQVGEFEDYLDHFYTSAGLFVGYFETLEEAEAWLMNHSDPPSSGDLLVGDTTYEIFYAREDNRRVLRREYVLERYIEIAMKGGLPSVVASFNTRAEADAWLAAHPNPPRAAFALIAGEYHLMAYFKNIDHRAIYPISLVERWEERKREVAEMKRHQGEEESQEES